MERLTYRINDRVCYHRNNDDDFASDAQMLAERLAEYEDLEEQGLLVKLNGIREIAKTERNKAIDDFLHNAEVKIYDRILQNQARLEFASGLSVANRMLDEVAEKMKITI